MILYHGSNVEVKQPHLLAAQRPLDFGPGFYTTSDIDQASKWAERTARIRNSGIPVVTTFEVDEGSFSELKILSFESADKEWLHLVAANRRQQADVSDWDIISGPVANDQTMPTLMLFLDGFLTEDETIARLLPQKLKDQFAFKTNAALAALHCVEARML